MDSDAEVAYEAEQVLSIAFGVELYEEQAAVPAKVCLENLVLMILRAVDALRQEILITGPLLDGADDNLAGGKE